MAREVGIEGKLGGQANVPGAAGTWRDLTDNVNQLAGNLTAQVRAIADVATAVAKGDLTRSIKVEAQGEVAAPQGQHQPDDRQPEGHDAQEPGAGLAEDQPRQFSSMMQGQKNIESVAQLIMSELTPLVDAHHGAFLHDGDDRRRASAASCIEQLRVRRAQDVCELVPVRREPGRPVRVREEEHPARPTSPTTSSTSAPGLGEAPPRNVIVLPVLFEGEIKAVIELASFNTFSSIHLMFLDQLMREHRRRPQHDHAPSMRTEELLQQSQSLTQELQNQSKELTISRTR